MAPTRVGGKGDNRVQCETCEQFVRFEYSGIEGKFDPKALDSLIYECRLCVWQKGVVARVDELENDLKDVKVRLARVERSVESVVGVKEECLSVKEGQDESAVSMDGVNAISAEVPKMGGQARAMAKTLAEIGERQTRVEELVGCGKVARVPYSVMASRNLQHSVSRVGGATGSSGRAAGRAAGVGGLPVRSAAHNAVSGALQVTGAVSGGAEVGDSAPGTGGNVGGNVAGNGNDGGGIVGGAVSGTTAGGQATGAVTVAEFGMKSKQYKDGTVLLLGDSMARGVGQHLMSQSTLFEKLDFSGARIEHFSQKLKVIGDRPDTNVVVMVGTNNLQGDCAEVMMEKYGKLVSDLKVRNYRKISMVGLVKRRDARFDRAVMLTNCKLRELCDSEGIGFVEPTVDRRTMLGKDGVHLNWRGCDWVARAIFQHSCSALNLV
jgi:hypothetical protein